MLIYLIQAVVLVGIWQLLCLFCHVSVLTDYYFWDYFVPKNTATLYWKGLKQDSDDKLVYVHYSRLGRVSRTLIHQLIYSQTHSLQSSFAINYCIFLIECELLGLNPPLHTLSPSHSNPYENEIVRPSQPLMLEHSDYILYSQPSFSALTLLVIDMVCWYHQCCMKYSTWIITCK